MAKEKDIAIMCPNLTCRVVLRVPSNVRGKKVRCMSCGTSLIIPASAGISPTAEPPTAPTETPAAKK